MATAPQTLMLWGAPGVALAGDGPWATSAFARGALLIEASLGLVLTTTPAGFPAISWVPDNLALRDIFGAAFSRSPKRLPLPWQPAEAPTRTSGQPARNT